MKIGLLNRIVCIKCKSKLKLETFLKHDAEIIDGLLHCTKCKAKYFIINGVPRMLSEELAAEFLSQYEGFFKKYKQSLPTHPDKSKKKMVKTAKGFGYEWKMFSKIHPIYEEQFLDWISPIKKEFFRNKLVLDAGCGKGRHTNFAAKYGAEVIGIDLSEAVDSAYQNTKHLKNAHIVQANIYELPFKESLFDYIYSIGVLHHLPYPQEGFNSLLKYLKKRGPISAWVYGKENNGLLRVADPIRMAIFSHLPLPVNVALSWTFTILLWPFMKLLYPAIDKIISSESIKNKLPQWGFFIYLSKLNFEIIHSIIFDQMLAPIANYYTRQQFEKWFTEAKLRNVYITWRNRNSWRGLGYK